MNAIFGLGLSKKDLRRASPFNKAFLRLLREKAPSIAQVFEDQDFIYWAKILRGARHWVAYMKASPSPATVFAQRRGGAHSRACGAGRWGGGKQGMAGAFKRAEWLAPGILEASRPTFRHKARIRRYKAIDEPVLRVELDEGEQALILSPA